MIKYWQSMDEYHYFLNEMKVHFDPSERARMHHELWIPWQKLRSFDTDRAMRFLEPRYSQTGRPAINQPQILRSFILFFLLIAQCLIPLSLTLLTRRLKTDRVLAALIGCTTDFLPPLGSYYDFMDRLWDDPDSDLYGRNKLLPASWKSTKPQKPKGRKQKAPERRPKITEKLGKHLLEHKDIPLNYEASLQKLFYLAAVLPWNLASFLMKVLPFPGTVLPYILMQIQTDIIRKTVQRCLPMKYGGPPGIMPTRMPPGDMIPTLIKAITDIRFFTFPVITAAFMWMFPCCSDLPVPPDMILSIFWSPSAKWKSIFPGSGPRIYAWIPLWITILRTIFLKIVRYLHSSILTQAAADLNQFLIPL